MEAGIIAPERLFSQPVRYEIPLFQRRYVWKQEEQWEPLWEDVENLAQSLVDGDDTEPHFMGAIVLKQRKVPAGEIEQRIVVDGQQRLTTLQLLIDAIQEVLENHHYKNPAKRLENLVLNGEQYCNGKDDHAFKVWPTMVDQEAFKHAMSNDLSSAIHAESQIVRGHNYFKEQAERWLGGFDNEDKKQKGANALDETVRKKLQIVAIDLGDLDDPHIIFETLNARGTPLLQSDMVKNKILHDTGIGLEDNGGDVSEAASRIWPFDQDKWWTEEVGRGMQRRPRVDVYLNHWLMLRNQKEVKSYNEFSAFNEYVKTRHEQGSETKDLVRDIANDLGKLGKVYEKVERDPIYPIAKFVSRRNVMGVGQVTPLLLWLLDADLDENVLGRSIRALESFLVRRMVCRLSTKSYGDLFVGLIKELTQDSAGRVDRILVSYLSKQKSQAGRWPRDEELLETFKTAPLYQILARGRLKMVLVGIEEELRRKKNKAEINQVPDKKLQIEHIMPQAWRKNWPLPENQARKEEEAINNRDRALHTIGNLTLVSNRLNPSLSDAPWNRKRELLRDYSVLYLNKNLVEHKNLPNWDETTIERRAKWLHEKAIKIWPESSSFERVRWFLRAVAKPGMPS